MKHTEKNNFRTEKNNGEYRTTKNRVPEVNGRQKKQRSKFTKFSEN